MCLITFEGNFERNFLSLLFYFHQRRRHRYCWCCYIAIVAAVVVIIFFLQWVWYLVVYFLRYSHSFIYLYVLILCMWVHLLFLLLVTPFPRVMCNIISLDLHIKYSHIYISYTHLRTAKHPSKHVRVFSWVRRLKHTLSVNKLPEFILCLR